jgi:hypothetical protein
MQSKPLPIGYVEIQYGWVGLKNYDELGALLQDVKDQGAREYPGLVYTGARLERTLDGAGVHHYTLYVGFAPRAPSSEPLDPRNLGGAPPAEHIGDPVRDFSVGMKEQRF